MVVLRELFESYEKFLVSKGVNFDRSWAISLDQGEFLKCLVKLIESKSILELGTGFGFSSLVFISVLDDLFHGDFIFDSIEIDKFKVSVFSSFLKIHNLDSSVNLINEDIFNFLSSESFISNFYDLIFVDALQKDSLRVFEIIVEKGLLSEKGIILFDNFTTHEGVYKLYENYLNGVFSGFEFINLNIGSGFLFIQKK